MASMRLTTLCDLDFDVVIYATVAEHQPWPVIATQKYSYTVYSVQCLSVISIYCTVHVRI